MSIQDSELSPNRQRVLALIGALAAAWALFLWWQLVRSRSGIEPFCAFGSSDCGALWDGSFANHVHKYTGLPVAAWGLLWGFAATLLPLLTRDRHDRSAIRWIALAGIASTIGLLLISAIEGLFCTSCAGTYLLVAAYAGLTWKWLPRSLAGGWKRASVVCLVAFAVLLYPGLKTPSSSHSHTDLALQVAHEDSTAVSDEAWPLPADGVEKRLRKLIADLPAEAQQGLSNMLAFHRQAPTFPLRPARAVHGEPDARLKITHFTDAQCSHCAQLHTTLDSFAASLPAAAFNVDSRHFPLDGNCNPHLDSSGPEQPRCPAARVLICAEAQGQHHQLAGDIYAVGGAALTTNKVFELAGKYMPQTELTSCIASADTAAKLAEDIDYVWQYKPHGTPVVLLNGRLGTSYGPFLYAMILTGGDTEHPVFLELPPPGQPPQG